MKLALKIYWLAALSLTFLTFQNCSKQSFQSLSDSAKFTTDTGGPNCRQVLDSTTLPVKMIFAIDVSGSNEQTDPDKSLRGGAISRFFNTYKTKPNFDWTVVSFSGDSATLRMGSGGTGEMEDVLDWFMSYDDNGGTPYVATLEKIYEFIEADQNRLAETKYLILFLSDGQPDPAVEDSVLQEGVEEILALSPGHISFNTVYYGPHNQELHDRLLMMADHGGGNFLDVNKNTTGGNFNISDLVIVPPVDQCDQP